MVRYTALILLAGILFFGCTKNTVSKIPQISLIAFMPLDTMTVNIDTVYLSFNLTDGDGDIGNDTTSGIFYEDTCATLRFITHGSGRHDELRVLRYRQGRPCQQSHHYTQAHYLSTLSLLAFLLSFNSRLILLSFFVK